MDPGEMENNLPNIPMKPFISCEKDKFILIDASEVKTTANLATLTPILCLVVGDGNIFQSTPLKAFVAASNDEISINCEGDSIVILDFVALAARKKTPLGEFLYSGGLDQGNEGLGWIPLR
jgi:hypothetical protein